MEISLDRFQDQEIGIPDQDRQQVQAAKLSPTQFGYMLILGLR